jgi:hypothetical protein
MRIGMVEAHQLNDLRQSLEDLARIVLKAPAAGGALDPAARAAVAARRCDAAAAREGALGQSVVLSCVLYLLHRILRGLEASRVQPSRRIRNGQGAVRRDFPSPAKLLDS